MVLLRILFSSISIEDISGLTLVSTVAHENSKIKDSMNMIEFIFITYLDN